MVAHQPLQTSALQLLLRRRLCSDVVFLAYMAALQQKVLNKNKQEVLTTQAFAIGDGSRQL